MMPNDRTRDTHPADTSADMESHVDAVGAYLLDALDEADLAAFEAYLRDDPGLQAEVADLRPIVDLLSLALEGDAVDIPEPSSNLRERILLSARDQEIASTPIPTRPSVSTVESVNERFQRPLLQSPPESSSAGGLLSFVRRIGIERLAAGFLAIIAVGAVIWALSLQNQLDDREDELAALQGESSVVAFGFAPTANGPAQASGALSILPGDTDSAELSLLNMPAIAEDQVYQTWFLDLDEAGNPIASRPGETFRPDASGTVKLSDVPFDQPFDAVGITLEPEGGSQTPTQPVLLIATQSFASG